MKKRIGAASFYIVAFSAVLFTIVALSFAAVVISEMNRTLNSDLSQSAYDSALAGIEDAKIAILNYQSCVNQGFTKETPNNDNQITCGEIIYYMEESNDCDAVANILGRPIAKDSSGKEIGVVISEKNTTDFDDSAMLQAYTCVKIESTLDNYLGTLSSSTPNRLVPLIVDNPDAVASIRVSWYSDTNGTAFNYSNFMYPDPDVTFPSLLTTKIATPPTISVGLIQTAPAFTMGDLDMSVGDRTNRGTLFFVPSDKIRTSNHQYKNGSSQTNKIQEATHMDITNDNMVDINEGFVKSNDKTSKNVPYLVYCPENSGSDFACSVTIDIPKPVGGDGKRNRDTFMLALSLLYNGPDTDFKIELCGEGGCKKTESIGGSSSGENIKLKNVQIDIDSTGRANDLYRRIETRVENRDTYFPIASYEVMLTGSGSEIDKAIDASWEYNFIDY